MAYTFAAKLCGVVASEFCCHERDAHESRLPLIRSTDSKMLSNMAEVALSLVSCLSARESRLVRVSRRSPSSSTRMSSTRASTMRACRSLCCCRNLRRARSSAMRSEWSLEREGICGQPKAGKKN
eukprot:6980694-Prymnesium_polylepis.2